jgi:hypothetical protein
VIRGQETACRASRVSRGGEGKDGHVFKHVEMEWIHDHASGGDMVIQARSRKDAATLERHALRGSSEA